MKTGFAASPHLDYWIAGSRYVGMYCTYYIVGEVRIHPLMEISLHLRICRLCDVLAVSFSSPTLVEDPLEVEHRKIPLYVCTKVRWSDTDFYLSFQGWLLTYSLLMPKDRESQHAIRRSTLWMIILFRCSHLYLECATHKSDLHRIPPTHCTVHTWRLTNYLIGTESSMGVALAVDLPLWSFLALNFTPTRIRLFASNFSASLSVPLFA